MYERFLEQNTGCPRQTVDDAFIAEYSDITPESLTVLWKEVGLGIFCNGLFRVINPADYQEFVNQYYQREYNEGATFGNKLPDCRKQVVQLGASGLGDFREWGIRSYIISEGLKN